MRVRLKGINSITKQLADGTRRTYWYAWKGGPALRGEPGTPEFIASYNAATAAKVVPPRGTLLSVLQGYQASEDFLAARTALAGRLHRQNKADREGIRRLSPVRADRPPHARRLQAMARAPCDVIASAGRLLPGLCSHASFHGAWIAGLSLPIHALAAGGSIAARVRRRFGPTPTRPRSSTGRRHTCACRYCSPCGPDSAKATCCGCPGRPTTGRTSACGSRRAARAW